MRHLNGIYAQAFNRVNKIDGPLFRGRYKAIIVEADDYLLRLNSRGFLSDILKSSWISDRGYYA
jgi:hypothetical protein